MSRLRFEIQGDPNNIALPTFSGATHRLVQLLAELDRAISGGGASLNWYLSGLSKNGTVALEVQSRLKKPLKGQRGRKDVSEAVADSFVTTFENIESKGISPPYLSEYGLERLRGMMALLHKNGAKGFTATSIDKQKSVQVTDCAEKTLRDLLPPCREYEGTIEGRLETISVHKQERFIVYHSLTNKAVTCRMSQNLISLHDAKEGLGHKVMVSGTLSINVKNEPLTMDVKSLRILGNKHLPRAAELTGSDPDFTGSLSTDEYIRSIRHA